MSVKEISEVVFRNVIAVVKKQFEATKPTISGKAKKGISLFSLSY